MGTHKVLHIWQEGLDIVEATYAMTADFPAEEMYGLTSQMRRAAVSVPSNIAEGFCRQGNKEFIQFLHVALGSLAELETQIIIASRLNYTNSEAVLQRLENLRKKLLNFIKHRKAIPTAPRVSPKNPQTHQPTNHKGTL